MVRFVINILFYGFFLLPVSNALLFLETLDGSRNFTHQVSTDAHDVLIYSEIRSVLDWYMLYGVNGIEFRIALLLQQSNIINYPEFIDNSLAVVGEIVTKCRHTPPVLRNGMKDVSSVVLSSSSIIVSTTNSNIITNNSYSSTNTTIMEGISKTPVSTASVIQILYTCSDSSTGTLNVLIAHWYKGNFTVIVDSPILSLGVARRWLLPRYTSVASVQLLYVLAIDTTISAILLENLDPITGHPSRITRIKLPQKTTTTNINSKNSDSDTELLVSCFLPSVGVSGLVRHSPTEGASNFELYRIFPSNQFAELLLDTSTNNIFTELTTEERWHCGPTTRVTFTDCKLNLSIAASLHVGITVTAMMESPILTLTEGEDDEEEKNNINMHKSRHWVSCGETLLEGQAIITEGGRRVSVSPLHRINFRPLVIKETIKSDKIKKKNDVTKGNMGHCIFYKSKNLLNCSDFSKPNYINVRGVSRHCIVLQVWWRIPSFYDQYLCDWFGVSLTEVITFTLIFFTLACVYQFIIKMFWL